MGQGLHTKVAAVSHNPLPDTPSSSLSSKRARESHFMELSSLSSFQGLPGFCQESLPRVQGELSHPQMASWLGMLF